MFRKIPGFSKYVINLQGEIRCVIGDKVISTHRSNGYVFVHILSDEGQPLSVGVHRCMALAFIDCPGDPKRMIVNHIDGCKWNNELKNLEWATRSRNQLHAVQMGTGSALPCTVINLETKEEKKFPTKREALRYLGYSSEQIGKATDIVIGGHRLIVETENLGYERFAENLRGLLIRDIYTNKITIVGTIRAGSSLTGVEDKVIKRILKGARFTFPVNGYDIRALSKNVVWPEYSSDELEAFKGLFFIHNPIWVTCPSGEKKLFGSVLRASAFTNTYERTIRECTKDGKPCARGFRYEKHKRKSISNI